MDQEKILEKHNYDYKKDNFFKRNEVKLEVLSLILVALGLMYLGTAILLNSKILNKSSTNNNQPTTVIPVEEKPSNTLPTDPIENKEENGEQTSNEEQTDIPTKQPTQTPLRFTVQNSIGSIIYSFDHLVGDVVTFDDVTSGGYFIDGFTNKVLFETKTNHNKVKCIIASKIEDSSCVVEELLEN